jgi:hypothetical protein
MKTLVVVHHTILVLGVSAVIGIGGITLAHHVAF